MKVFSRRGFLSALASSLAGTALANAPAHSLRPVARPGTPAPVAEIETLIKAARLRGTVSVAVADMQTGAMIESHNEDLGLPPASVTKVITALYALETLGAEHQFQTRLIGTGPVKQGVLQGDLILAGGGDPSLDTDTLEGLAQSLAEQGVTAITGRFLVYGGVLPYVDAIDGGQPVQVGYSPAISGIALNYNRVFLEWKIVSGAPQLTLDARSITRRPPVQFATVELSERLGPVYDFDGKGGRDRWSLAKSALKQDGGRWLPVRQPELYAAEVFKWLANEYGVRLPASQKTTSRPKGTNLAIHRSAPLLELLRGMLKYSTNVTAEMVGLSASLARGTYVASLAASGREMAAWAEEKLHMQGAKFVDHSGLSAASRLPARALVKGLAAAQSHRQLQPILKEVGIKDAKGRPVQDHPLKVVAKTGTLNYVSGLAGYIDRPDNEHLAFAIFSADLDIRATLTRAERERPRGARSWNARARNLQQELIKRWGTLTAR